jgi:hypothetical protein
MMVLIIAAISLAVMGTLMQVVFMGTQLSGGQKRFTTALEAGKGGGGVVRQWIGARNELDSAYEDALFFEIPAGVSNTCIADKLNNATADWDNCTDIENTELTIDVNNNKSYDFSFKLGDYDVYGKIVNTIEGNTGASGEASNLRKGGVVASNSGEVEVKPVSAIYTIELDSRNTINPVEKAKLSILYQY